MRACADCGEPTENYGRCNDCRPVEAARPERGTTTERGYGTAWRKLSERARRMQRWCLDCGATTDLTVDHLPIAWERYNAGKPVRPQDVEVVCRRCNSRRGAARPSSSRSDTRGDARTPRGSDPRGKAKFASQMGTVADSRLEHLPPLARSQRRDEAGFVRVNEAEQRTSIECHPRRGHGGEVSVGKPNAVGAGLRKPVDVRHCRSIA